MNEMSREFELHTRYTIIMISDETFYAQSQIMVEKVPEFSAESLCLRQGIQKHSLPNHNNVYHLMQWLTVWSVSCRVLR